MSYRFDETRDIILFKLYEYYRDSKSTKSLSKDAISAMAPADVSPMFALRAVEYLNDGEYLIETDRLLHNFEISSEGIRYVENAIDNTSSFLSKYIRSRDDSSERELENNDQVEDDRWVPLKIDRETPTFQNAVTAIESVIETVEGDNGYAANEPEERNNILWSLKEGIAAIKEALPSRNQIQALIVAPLNFLVRKFAETSIGEVAKIAVAKVGE